MILCVVCMYVDVHMYVHMFVCEHSHVEVDPGSHL